MLGWGALRRLNRILGGLRSAARTVASPVVSPAAASSLVYAAARGPVLVELRNLPFDAARPEAEVAVLAALAQPVSAYPLGFTTDPGQAPVPGIRILLAFHPAPDSGPAALVRGDLKSTLEKDRLTLLAVLANGETVLASVTGRANGVVSIADPAFAALLRQTVRDLVGQPSFGN